MRWRGNRQGLERERVTLECRMPCKARGGESPRQHVSQAEADQDPARPRSTETRTRRTVQKIEGAPPLYDAKHLHRGKLNDKLKDEVQHDNARTEKCSVTLSQRGPERPTQRRECQGSQRTQTPPQQLSSPTPTARTREWRSGGSSPWMSRHTGGSSRTPRCTGASTEGGRGWPERHNTQHGSGARFRTQAAARSSHAQCRTAATAFFFQT